MSDSEGPVGFMKGGAGCIGLFFGVGLLALLCGGNVHFDFLGLVMLFVIGGALGLGINYIYRKGQNSVE